MSESSGNTLRANLGFLGEVPLGLVQVRSLHLAILDGPVESSSALIIGESTVLVGVDFIEGGGGFSLGGTEVLDSSSGEGVLGDVGVLKEEISGLLGISLRHVSTLDGLFKAALDFTEVELAIFVLVTLSHDLSGSGEGFFSVESDGGSSSNKSEEFHVV